MPPRGPSSLLCLIVLFIYACTLSFVFSLMIYTEFVVGSFLFFSDNSKFQEFLFCSLNGKDQISNSNHQHHHRYMHIVIYACTCAILCNSQSTFTRVIAFYRKYNNNIRPLSLPPGYHEVGTVWRALHTMLPEMKESRKKGKKEIHEGWLNKHLTRQEWSQEEWSHSAVDFYLSGTVKWEPL